MGKFNRIVFCMFSIHAAPLSADGWLDWVPGREKLEYCDTYLTDIIGVNAAATASLWAMGPSVTTTTIAPALFFIAGESSMMVISGTSVSVVATPVVGTAVGIGAAVATVAYGGGKTLCQLSEFLENNFITNEPIPLVTQISNHNFGLSDKELFASGESRFIETNEVIPVGTPVFSLGPLSEDAAAYYPNYNGRGLIQLGRFFDKSYKSEIPEDQRGYAVVPANSLNSILLEKYTHIFIQDTLVERNGEEVMLTAGTPFQLLKERKDGWAKIELSDFFNLWVENFSSVETRKIADFKLSKIDP
jgi:hypothetical protein